MRDYFLAIRPVGDRIIMEPPDTFALILPADTVLSVTVDADFVAWTAWLLPREPLPREPRPLLLELSRRIGAVLQGGVLQADILGTRRGLHGPPRP